MKRVASAMLLLSAVSQIAYAENDAENETPSLEFLEFLGSFETDSGEWLNPMEIEKMLNLTQQALINQEKDNE